MISRKNLLRITLCVVTLSVLIAVMALPALAVFPTTMPTVPVATYDPCYDGHTYIDGFCTYCGAYDPSYIPPTSIAPNEEPNYNRPADRNDSASLVSPDASSSAFSVGFFSVIFMIGIVLVCLIPVVLVILLIVVVIILIVMLIKKKKN